MDEREVAFEKMTIDCDSSPVDQADDGSSELNVSALSLPDSFDDTFCLDLYKNLICEAAKTESSSKQLPISCSQDPQSIKASLSPPSYDMKILQVEELQARIRQLLAANLELKEKSMSYDNLSRRHIQQEAEIEELSTKLSAQKSFLDSCTSREKKFQQQFLELQKKNNLINIELEHSQKEVELLTKRAEKSEKENESNARSLNALQIKHDTLISCHTTEQEELKKKFESKIARVQSESNQEIVSSRNNQKESFARETKLLHDARDYAIDQAKMFQQELNDLRSDRERKDDETSDIIAELKKQLADCRGDLKVKLCELSNLQGRCNGSIEEANHFKSENEKLRKELQELYMKYAKLEEVIRQKEDALEIYQHDDLFMQHDDSNLSDPNIDTMAAKRKSIIKTSVILAKKCRELRCLLQESTAELSLEKEKNVTLTRQAENDKRLFHDLMTKKNRNVSDYVLAAVNEREKEISRLNNKVNSIQTELDKTKHERNNLAAELAEILERRKGLESMKVLVDEGIKQMKLARMTKDVECKSEQDTEDFLEHIYHKSTRE